jgi:hypothetical protein
VWTRENHIHTLARAIQDKGKPLERLLVLPVGESFYVIDGHHRLAAYDTAGWTKGIPVEVFTGSLTEARVRALASNVQDKLPMTTQAKSEAAWRITKENLGKPTVEQVQDWTGISPRQVKYIRKAWRELNEREGADREELMKLTWGRARVLWQTGEELESSGNFDQEAWIEKKAQEVIDLMQRTNVAAGIMQDIEVTALALQRLHGGLPEALIEQWARDYPELIETLAVRLRIGDPDEVF